MTDTDLIEFLKTPRWHLKDKYTLIDEFNARLRPRERAIKINSVSSPCRLRQVVGSLKNRILQE
jgi:hypothetical protein